MKYIAGVDIGNSTTEVCIGEITLEGKVVFLSSASCPTTGTKGTVENTHAIKTALKAAMSKINKEISDISLIRLNEAAPVIGDTAMETLTETIITDSSMIGHTCGGGTGSRRDSRTWRRDESGTGEALYHSGIKGIFLRSRSRNY